MIIKKSLPVVTLAYAFLYTVALYSAEANSTSRLDFSAQIEHDHILENERKERATMTSALHSDPLYNSRYSLSERILIAELARRIMEEYGPKIEIALATKNPVEVAAQLQASDQKALLSRPQNTIFLGRDVEMVFWSMLNPECWKLLQDMKHKNQQIYQLLGDIQRYPLVSLFARYESR